MSKIRDYGVLVLHEEMFPGGRNSVPARVYRNQAGELVVRLEPPSHLRFRQG